jgi:hypothetical protein
MLSLRAKAALACGAVLAAGVRLGRHSKTADVEATYTATLLDGKIDIKRPAFMMYDAAHDDVVVSQFGKQTPLGVFNPFNLPAQSSIMRIPRSTIASEISSGKLASKFSDRDNWVKAGDVIWPNKLSKTPTGYPEYTVVPDGFLPPGKTDGGVFLVSPNGAAARITAEKKDAFYHEVEWHDFNGDGHLDLLTARVIKGGPFWKPVFEGELMWLENPGKNQMTSQYWKEHVITQGPDVIFKSKPYNGGLAVYCTEFFRKEGPRITLRFLDASGTQTFERVVDESTGKPMGVRLGDLDGDGHDELIVTNHQDNDDDVKAGVFAFEIPSDLKYGAFVKHTLCYDVTPVVGDSPGVGAPGFAEVFHPRVGAGPSERKHLVVAGDGTFDVWYLKPVSGGRFKYETQIITLGGTTGELLVMDFDNDGVNDVLIPDNDNFNLRAITFTR